MITYELKYPTEQLKELNIRRSTVADSLKISNISNEELKIVTHVANLTEQNLEVIKQLDEYDFMEVYKIVQGFFNSQT